MINRHIQTIFCDDIRQEINGKLSYIGVYSGFLYVESFPTTLPKFCLSIRVVTSADKPFGPLTMRVLKDDVVLQEIVVDEEKLGKTFEIPEELKGRELTELVQSALFLFVFSPFQLDAPCVLRVRAETEDGELQGMGLKISHSPELPAR